MHIYLSNWHLGANDPDFIGWMTVAAYLVAMVLCWLCGRRAADANSRLFWRIAAALLLMLGINKQLDLQTVFIAGGRAVAESEGWYAQRRLVKWMFVFGLGVSGIGALAWLTATVRHVWRDVVFAFAGLGLLLLFVLVRAAPAQADRVLHIKHPIPAKRHVLELTGIACIGAAAGLRLRRNNQNGASGGATAGLGGI